MHLCVDLYASRPVFEDAVCDKLDSIFKELLPEWRAGLKVLRHDHTRARNVQLGERLADALGAEAPPRRGLGSAVLKGEYEGVSAYVHTCSSTLPAELNKISVEIEEDLVEGFEVATWARRFFAEASNRLSLRYGKACLADEFEAKNLVNDSSGVRAIGVRLSAALPGLYWLNFLGAPYVALLGDGPIRTAPCHELAPADDGYILSLAATPTAWQSADYRAREEAMIRHLGGEFFFSRAEPERATRAPDFRNPRRAVK